MKNLAAFIIVVFSFFSYEINAQTTYLWSNGETTPSINVNPSVTTTYLVTITNNGVNYYDSLVITVNSNSVITGSNFVCINGTSQLSATYTPASSNPWSSSNTDVATVSDTGLVAGISSGTSTITYTNVDNCQVTKVITVTPQTTPTFNAIEPICSGVVIDALPNISTNGITGTWSPAINNNVTTTYSFTPDAGQCATTTTQTINITAPKVTSPISFVAPTTTVAALTNVTIGTQIWTSKNLDVSTYRDGTPIPQVTDPTQWENLTTGAWCYYDNNPANGEVYGKLYNWYAVAGIYDAASFNDTTLRKQFAPVGWHVPSDLEWTTLTTFLGGESVAGGMMKETSTELWNSPNQDANNSSGFSGIPGGYRRYDESFFFIGNYGFWWSSSEYDPAGAWFRHLYNNLGNAYRSNTYKAYGFSVRLIKD